MNYFIFCWQNNNTNSISESGSECNNGNGEYWAGEIL